MQANNWHTYPSSTTVCIGTSYINICPSNTSCKNYVIKNLLAHVAEQLTPRKTKYKHIRVINKQIHIKKLVVALWESNFSL